jgi:dienelactone hydrolase
MHEERILIGEVPVRIYAPDGARGLLLFGHGGDKSKDGTRFVRLCRYYAAQTGRAAICIDAVDHGERKPVAATEGVPPNWHSRAISRMVADWRTVVSDLSSLGTPMAYVGFSMGAVFGFPTVASMPNITAAVFVVGGIPASDWADDVNLASSLTSAAAHLDHAHVLMANKDDDVLFPASGVHRLFESVVAKSKQLKFGLEVTTSGART